MPKIGNPEQMQMILTPSRAFFPEMNFFSNSNKIFVKKNLSKKIEKKKLKKKKIFSSPKTFLKKEFETRFSFNSGALGLRKITESIILYLTKYHYNYTR